MRLFSNRSQRTSKCGANFLFLPHFDVICDLLLNRCTATWNIFVKLCTLSRLPFVNQFYCPSVLLFRLWPVKVTVSNITYYRLKWPGIFENSTGKETKTVWKLFFLLKKGRTLLLDQNCIGLVLVGGDECSSNRRNWKLSAQVMELPSLVLRCRKYSASLVNAFSVVERYIFCL